MTSAAILTPPDHLAAWLRLERLTRQVIGRRMEEGTTSESDEALDRLIALRRSIERRLSN